MIMQVHWANLLLRSRLNYGLIQHLPECVYVYNDTPTVHVLGVHGW